MNRKSLMKHHHLKEKKFIATMEDITDADYMHAKKVFNKKSF